MSDDSTVAAPDRPSVSVVMPVHGAQPDLGAQLTALLGQDYDGPIEFLVADNGMDSVALAKVESAMATDSRMRLVEARDRRGVPGAVLAAVDVAVGALICRCDADDVVSAGWVSGLADAAATADLVGGFLDVVPLNDPGFRTYRSSLTGHGLPLDVSGQPFVVGANGAFWRRAWDQLGGYCPNLVPSEDVDFSARAHGAGMTVAFAPHAEVAYRHRTQVRAIARQARSYGRGPVKIYTLDGHRPERRALLWWVAKGLVAKPSGEAATAQFRGWVWRSQVRLGYALERFWPTPMVPCSCHPAALVL